MARELKELLHSSAIVGQVLGREFSVCDNNTPSYNKVFSIIKDLRRPSFCTTSIKGTVFTIVIATLPTLISGFVIQTTCQSYCVIVMSFLFSKTSEDVFSR
jgi:hypothetical protein